MKEVKWQTVKLGEIATQDRVIITPDSPEVKTRPFLGLDQIEANTGRILSYDSTSAEGKGASFAFDTSHVLYGKLRPYLNKVAIPEQKGRCSTEIIPLKPDGVDRDFLGLLLRKNEIVEVAMSKKTGSRMPRADMASLLSFEIKIPKLIDDQRCIASRLKAQLAEVEKARHAAEARLDETKSLPMALFRQTFSGPSTKKWTRMPFGQVVMLQRGHDLTGKNREAGPYPVVTSSGIVGTHCEFRAKGPGVVTGRSGSVGRVHYVESDYWPHNTALYVKNFFGNNPRYIYYLMQWLNVKSVSSGTGVPTLDRKEVHKIAIFHPPIEEQKRIAQELDDKLDIIIQAKKSLEAELKDINMLPATLLRQAFEM